MSLLCVVLLYVAIYTFSGEGQYKLPLRFGDVVEIWEECSGWYRGCLRFDPSKKVRGACGVGWGC